MTRVMQCLLLVMRLLLLLLLLVVMPHRRRAHNDVVDARIVRPVTQHVRHGRSV